MSFRTSAPSIFFYDIFNFVLSCCRFDCRIGRRLGCGLGCGFGCRFSRGVGRRLFRIRNNLKFMTVFFGIFLCVGIFVTANNQITVECIITDACDAVGNCYACKSVAIGKCNIADGCDVVGNCYACKPGAAPKCIIFDIGNTVGDYQTCQSGAIGKSITSNTCNTSVCRDNTVLTSTYKCF